MTTYNEALDKYYNLKSTYETEYDKEKKSLINNNGLSWKEKRANFKQLKPKCVNCKRAVGTKFLTEYNNSTESRMLLAVCGDKVNPCNLNINLNAGNFENLQSIVKNEEIRVKQIKDEIIKIKNSLLFGYITTDDMIKNFNVQKENMNNSMTILENYLLEYLDITDNKENQTKLNTNIEESYTIITAIKNSMKQFKLTSDTQFVKDSVQIYVNQLVPKIKTIADLMYNNRYVDYNESTNTYHLINNKHSIQQLEYDIVPTKINSYIFGTTNSRNKTAKTHAKPQIVKPITTNKTAKNKKRLLIIDSSSTSSSPAKKITSSSLSSSLKTTSSS